MRVKLSTRKAAPAKGERVKLSGLVYYVAEAADVEQRGEHEYVGTYDIQPTDAGKGTTVHLASLAIDMEDA